MYRDCDVIVPDQDYEALGALFRAISAVMAATGSVSKSHVNKQQGFAYASEADILRELRPALAEHGLSFIPAGVRPIEPEAIVTDRVGRDNTIGLTTVAITYVVAHRDGGYLLATVLGQGADSFDKGVYKAYTGAFKYLLRQTFAIPTGDDPDEASEAATRPARRPARQNGAPPAAQQQIDWVASAQRLKASGKLAPWVGPNGLLAGSAGTPAAATVQALFVEAVLEVESIAEKAVRPLLQQVEELPESVPGRSDALKRLYAVATPDPIE